MVGFDSTVIQTAPPVSPSRAPRKEQRIVRKASLATLRRGCLPPCRSITAFGIGSEHFRVVPVFVVVGSPGTFHSPLAGQPSRAPLGNYHRLPAPLVLQQVPDAAAHRYGDQAFLPLAEPAARPQVRQHQAGLVAREPLLLRH